MAHVEPTASEREVHVGSFSNTTQEMANDLPMWHIGRRLRTSTWQSVMNAMMGRQAGAFEDRADDAALAMLLPLADVDVPDTVLRHPVPASHEIKETYNSRNYVLNGAFRIRTNPYMVADWWSYTGTVGFGQGLFHNNSIALDPTLALSRIQQQQYLDFPAGTRLCVSVHYRIPTWPALGVTVPNTHGIDLTVQYKDGTTTTTRSLFDAHTQGQWERAYTALTATSPVDSVTVRIHSQVTGSFGITQPVYVDGCMLELATRPGQWEPSRLDSPHYISLGAPAPIDFEAEYPVVYVDNLHDFWYRTVPTRTGVTDTRANTIGNATNVGFTRIIDYHDVTWEAEFELSANTIRKVGTTCPGEVYGQYDLAFYNPRGFYELNLTYTVLAITWFQDRIWAVLSIRDLPDGITKAVLAVIEPNVPTPEPAYLEVIGAVELPGVPTDIDRMEFRYDDQQHVYVSNGTDEYRIRLFYDYYMFDHRTYYAYFREEYDQLVLTNKFRGLAS